MAMRQAFTSLCDAALEETGDEDAPHFVTQKKRPDCGFMEVFF